MINSPQNIVLREWLVGTDNSITSKQALKRFHIANLRARMTEFRKMGYLVATSANSAGTTSYRIF